MNKTSKSTKGVVRNRSRQFFRIREEYHSRFGTDRITIDIELKPIGKNEEYYNASLLEKDVEEGTNNSQPGWMAKVGDININIDLIKSKIGELSQLHEETLMVSIEENNNSQEIEVMTAAITRLFGSCQNHIKSLTTIIKHIKSIDEAALLRNLQQCAASSLQELSKKFRKEQQSYLTKLRNRDKKATFHGISNEEDDIFDYEDKGFNESQLMRMGEADKAVEQRTRELRRLAQSIVELSEMMKDIAMLVADQGTLLDRIDYNIEQAEQHVEEGVEELNKASESQKASRKKLIIIGLIILVFCLAVVLFVRITTK